MKTITLHRTDAKEVEVPTESIITYVLSKDTQNVTLVTTNGNIEVLESLYYIDALYNIP